MKLTLGLAADHPAFVLRDVGLGAIPDAGAVTVPTHPEGAIVAVEYHLVALDGRGVPADVQAWAVIAAGLDCKLIGKRFADMAYVGEGQYRLTLCLADDELPGNALVTTNYAALRHELRGLPADCATVAICERRLIPVYVGAR